MMDLTLDQVRMAGRDAWALSAEGHMTDFPAHLQEGDIKLHWTDASGVVRSVSVARSDYPEDHGWRITGVLPRQQGPLPDGVVITDTFTLPVNGWHHLPGCDCEFCTA